MLTRALRELERRKEAALKEVERIEEVLTALRGIGTGWRRAKAGPRRGRQRRRRMSAEARRKIAPA